MINPSRSWWLAEVVGGLLSPSPSVKSFPNPSVFVVIRRASPLFTALATMIVGQIAAWKWESISGVLILASFVLFAVVNHGVQINLVFGPWLLTGLLYFVCGWMQSGAVRLTSLS